MAIATEQVAQTFYDVVAATPVNCNFPLYAEDEVEVIYGIDALIAVYPTDFTVTLAGAPDFESFTVTPTASLLTKINNLIAADDTEVNYITVRRKLDYLTSITPEEARRVIFLSREIERMHMKLQQLAEGLGRALGFKPSNISDPEEPQYIDNLVADALLKVNATADGIEMGPSFDEVENLATAADASADDAAASASAALASEIDALASQTAAAASATLAIDAINSVVDAYTFDNATAMADPGTGEVRLNNATLSSVTQMAISALTAVSGNPNIRAFINTWDDSTSSTKGYITIKKRSTPSVFAKYQISAAITDNTSWLQVTLVHVASNGTFSSGDILNIEFTPNGDKGDVNASANITDNALVRGDGGVKGVQGSPVIVDDLGSLSGVNNFDAAGVITSTVRLATNQVIRTTNASGFDFQNAGATTLATLGNTGRLSLPISGGGVDSAGNIIINNAAYLALVGSGANPNKYLLSDGTNLLVKNSAYSADLLTLSNSGVANFLAGLQINGQSLYPTKTALYTHTEAANVAGGSSTSGSFQKRTLNTENHDDIGIGLSASVMSVPAGTYLVDGMSAFRCTNLSTGNGVARLRDTTNNVTLAESSSGLCSTSNSINREVRFTGRKVVIAGTINVELQYQVDASLATNGLGAPCNLGNQEIYAEVFWRKIV